MWATAHAACGAAIGSVLSNPLVIAATAVTSHLVLDAIPHWDYPAKPSYVLVDLFAAAVIVGLFGESLHWWGAFWAVVPDTDVVLVHLEITSDNAFPSHQSWFPHNRATAIWGAGIQILLISFCFLISFGI